MGLLLHGVALTFDGEQPGNHASVLARYFDQTKASRFLVTNSSTVIGGRPPISAM